MGEGSGNDREHGPVIGPNSLAIVDFVLDWEKDGVRHRAEKRHRRINMWRDMFPAGLDAALFGRGAGDVVEIDCPVGSLVEDRAKGEVFEIRERDFKRDILTGMRVEPDFGRFYPRGILEGVRGTFRQDRRPFRCLDRAEDRLTVDFNHPFAGIPARLAVRIGEVAEQGYEQGGRVTDWMHQISDGPGIEARADGLPTDFYFEGAFSRAVEEDDATFYAKPRMTVHLDSAALAIVAEIYGEVLADGMAVLDLMSSLHSHVPEGLELSRLAGLGLNADELAANARLTDHVVHDLNADPRLPYEDAGFDAAISTVSIEYLTDPVAVVDEVARVLKPGAPFAVTFSHRWFPPKVVAVWRQAHAFERIGLVTEYFLRTGRFADLRTISVEGLPRPADDPYAGSEAFSDPVFAVIGRKVAR
ncbi:MAG TPA: methyltransferase domain-containing protein [Kaistiaceae bacterium]|nr:methyltransferase domain-containing protein [Kaistiaceae bacterium]